MSIQLQHSPIGQHSKQRSNVAYFQREQMRLFRRVIYDRIQKKSESIQEFTTALNTMAERSFGPQAAWPDNIRAIVKDQ